jgi:predicted aspartyl protease
LVINEEIRQQLGLKTSKTITATLADGSIAQYDLSEAINIRWKDRSTVMDAVIAPNAKTVLLGAIPLEGLDLYVDPVNKKLVGVHGDSPMAILYGGMLPA